MFRKIAITAALLAAGTAAFAHDMSSVARIVSLQDGSSVYIFKDGKMAMQDQYGRAVAMSDGQKMPTRDGQTIAMAGNETARLDCVLKMMMGGGK